MLFSSDMFLSHTIWDERNKVLSEKNSNNEKGLQLFTRLVDLFIVACSIGICEDKVLKDNCSQITSIGRNTLQTNSDINVIMEFMFQNAILNTKTIDLDLETRKRYAFGDAKVTGEFSPVNFLPQFANYGMTVLMKCVTENDVETADNIKNLIDEYMVYTQDLEEDYEIDEI